MGIVAVAEEMILIAPGATMRPSTGISVRVNKGENPPIRFWSFLWKKSPDLKRFLFGKTFI